MAELKEVKVFHYVIEQLKGIFTTCRLEIHDGDKNVGYYRIWSDKTTVNVAYYSERDRHGVLPPGEYKVIPTNHKLIKLIEKDLNLMGYTIPDGHKMLDDGMLSGLVPCPTGWAGWFEDTLYEPTAEEIFKVNIPKKEQ